MSEYAVSVFAVSVAVGVASMLLHGKDKAGKTALSVLMLYAVAMPLLASAPWSPDSLLGDLPQYDIDTEGGEYVEVAREALEKGLAEAIEDEFSLSEGEVIVFAADFDLKSPEEAEIRVILRGGGARVDPARVEKFVTDAGFRRCRVEFEI